MYSLGTENYDLPQWQPNDKPTFLGDFNEAFRKIDSQMKINYELARRGGGSVPQDLIDQVNQNSVDIGTLAGQIGTDNIASIGSSITNAIVNTKGALDTMATNVSGMSNKIGTDDISSIGTSITNAIIVLKNAIDALSQNR